MLYPSEPPSAMPRTSWWRSLIAATLAPTSPPTSQGAQSTEGEESADRKLGKVCVGLALAFAFAALLVGLRSASGDVPTIAVALVVSRTVVALSLVAFGYALLRMGERLLTARSVRRSES
jgi:hypothetical protein